MIDTGDGNPMICTGGVGDSYPPTCGDIEIANWSWDSVDGEVVISGIRWGVFHFVGLADGGRFYVIGFLP